MTDQHPQTHDELMDVPGNCNPAAYRYADITSVANEQALSMA